MGREQDDGPVVVGKVLAARGLAGQLKIEPLSDFPGRFAPGGYLFLEGTPHLLQRSTKLPDGSLAIKLEGIDSREDAQKLLGLELTVPRDMVPPPPEGSYYHFQLIDMEVYTVSGDSLGALTEILDAGPNDVYIVTKDGREVLVPALEGVVLDVDVESARMTVDLPEGLRP